MHLVVALGGNALLKRGEPMTAETQRGNVIKAATALATLVADGHQITITHGNGPQVGLIALQAAAGPADGAYPLDILGAESEGMIGYLLEQELRNALPAGADLATLLTQVRVDPADPAFLRPTKPIGPVYDEPTARRLEAERGWQCARDGDKWRRVVASPEPLEILGLKAITTLAAADVMVICAGGGGVPVAARPGGGFIGVEAVIDKDRASALLAQALKADMLLLLTDVDGVYLDFGTPSARRILRAGTAILSPNSFAAGSMGPKVQAALRFTQATGGRTMIGRLEDARALVSGTAGTSIETGPAAIITAAIKLRA
ncbi:carbamate kinase [Elstera sp.]|uniref:carbamate kinase n=1 Tax=Elstera sp. TaxID=1916664 RepID=UPI0037C0BEBF